MQYTYKCLNTNCNHEFILEQSLNSEHIANCPKCNSECKRIFKINVNLTFKDSYNSSK